MLIGLAAITGHLVAELPERYPQLVQGPHKASALGLFTVVVTAYLVLRPPEPGARLREGTPPGSGTCCPGTARGTHSATSRCAATRA
jgi:hypothetical protein